MTENFSELFEASIKNLSLSSGSIIKATIIDIGNEYVVVNAGLKSEGYIPLQQFKDINGELEITIGEQVDVAIDSFEDGFGETILSREKAKRQEAWLDLSKAHESKETVSGLITGKVKGGFTVELNGVRAFLPGSLVDVRPVRDSAYLEGKQLEFKVIKMDKKRNNVVVSRRAVVESESSAEREALIENLKEGSEAKGIVKNLTDYGAFVDLGGVDGLLHITDMSWKRVKHPSEIVSVGDEVAVKVLKFDKERNRVSLGLKQLGDDPWFNIARRYPVGTRLFGKVTNLTDYGCFVEIEDGVEGLVHVSEMDWTNKNIHPKKVVQLGVEVEVMVLEIDEDRRRISLGVKQCKDNPWEVFAHKHEKGQHISGKIKSITDFGIFIGLDGGIDGLVHLSDIAWNISGEEAVRQYKKGQDVETIILAVDPERERISLGIKQLDDDPMGKYMEGHPRGAVVTGKVSHVEAKFATITLDSGVEAQLKAGDFSRHRTEDLTAVLNVGDSIEAKIVSVDRKTNTIALSIKAMESDDLEEFNNSNPEVVGTTLGDLLKAKMNNQSQEG